MNSKALLLGAAVSALSGAAFAADDEKYWEQRDVAPAERENPRPDEKYWENRDKNPALITSNEAGDEAREAARRAAQDVGEAAEETAEAASEAADAAARQMRGTSPQRGVSPDIKPSRIGVAVEAGGGFGGFVDSRVSSQTTTQGQWTGRVIFGTRRNFAGEVAYVGSAQGVTTLGVQEGAIMTGTGAEGLFRLNVLTGMWQPYAAAGIGFMHYSLNNAQLTTSDVQPNGDVATFPLGVGLAWRMQGIVLDARLSFHPATISGILRNNNMSTWDVNGKAGFEF